MTRSPDFHLKALNKRTDERTGKIGAAWKNQDGSITIKLDMFINLQYDPDLLITLFVNDRPVDTTPAAQFVDPFALPRPAAKRRQKNSIVEAPVSVRHTISDNEK